MDNKSDKNRTLSREASQYKPFCRAKQWRLSPWRNENPLIIQEYALFLPYNMATVKPLCNKEY